MIFLLFDLLTQDPGSFLRLLPIIMIVFGGALLSALTIHEFGHAAVAHSLGDETARSMGRLSLNPLRHLDPVGTIMIFLVGFGWGRPVPVNPYLLQYGRKGMALVSAAGPASNFLLAAALSLLVRLGPLGLADWSAVATQPTSALAWLSALATYAILFNVLLGIFNLIPLTPLDGSKVLIGLSPLELARKLGRLEQYGPIALVVIVGADFAFGTRILANVLIPPVRWLSKLLTGVPLL